MVLTSSQVIEMNCVAPTIDLVASKTMHVLSLLNLSNAFLSSPQVLKNQTSPCEPYTQALVDHALVCEIMCQIKPISYVFH
jgi:hypothetical protein